MHRLKNEDFEHQHMIEGGSASFRPVRARRRRIERRTEHLEINESFHALQIVALG